MHTRICTNYNSPDADFQTDHSFACLLSDGISPGAVVGQSPNSRSQVRNAIFVGNFRERIGINRRTISTDITMKADQIQNAYLTLLLRSCIFHETETG